jgi:indolepyruvate ferredoxin oxidoreductase beta subunit
MQTGLSASCYNKDKMKSCGLNILIAGVGGQGVLLLGDIIARVLVSEGYDVKASALRGMAQRGGTIFSHIRSGKRIYSPLIPKGKADILVALELIECTRQVEYLKKDGWVFFVDRYMPQGIAKGSITEVSGDIIKGLKENFKARAVQIPYARTVKNLKNVKMVNIFILGVLSNYFSINNISWLKAIAETFSGNMKGANFSVFSAGRNLDTTLRTNIF